LLWRPRNTEAGSRSFHKPIATKTGWLHDYRMGSGRITPTIPDLLSSASPQDKQFGFNERIVGPLDKFPIPGRLIL
jgi:hypothetical protein